MAFLKHLIRHSRHQARPAPAPPVSPSPYFPSVNELLHELRGYQLRDLPRNIDTFISVGCSGTWYFDWIKECCGPLKRHVGVEYYSQQPKDLPDNAEWIANTASNMSAIPSETADLVFSGRNIEHLWHDEVAGFLLEANRILKPGGLLVIDSPNRTITAPLGWSHPEHTVEFSASEITDAVRMAGFDNIRLSGIWLCRDPLTGAPLPFDAQERGGDWPMVRRIIAGRYDPENAFIWWLQCRKETSATDKDAVARHIETIYSHAFPERLRRRNIQHGKRISREGETWIRSDPGWSGALLYGPYFPLRAGSYSVVQRIRRTDAIRAAAAVIAVCDIVSGDGTVVHAARDVTLEDLTASGEAEVRLGFNLSQTTFALQSRVIATGAAQIDVDAAFALEREAPDHGREVWR